LFERDRLANSDGDMSIVERGAMDTSDLSVLSGNAMDYSFGAHNEPPSDDTVLAPTHDSVLDFGATAPASLNISSDSDVVIMGHPGRRGIGSDGQHYVNRAMRLTSHSTRRIGSTIDVANNGQQLPMLRIAARGWNTNNIDPDLILREEKDEMM
jgi:hypothetical protein